MALFVHLYIHFSANVSDILNLYINVQTIFLSLLLLYLLQAFCALPSSSPIESTKPKIESGLGKSNVFSRI